LTYNPKDLLLVKSYNTKLLIDGDILQKEVLYSRYDEEMHILAAISELLIEEGYKAIAFFLMVTPKLLCVRSAIYSYNSQDFFYFKGLKMLDNVNIYNTVGNHEQT
jgi:hypothetical protein